MTACDDRRRRIGALVDGEIEAEDLPELTAHLGECEACRTYEDQLRGLALDLSVMADIDRPDLVPPVMATIGAEGRGIRGAALRRLWLASGGLAATGVALGFVFAAEIVDLAGRAALAAESSELLADLDQAVAPLAGSSSSGLSAVDEAVGMLVQVDACPLTAVLVLLAAGGLMLPALIGTWQRWARAARPVMQ